MVSSLIFSAVVTCFQVQAEPCVLSSCASVLGVLLGPGAHFFESKFCLMFLNSQRRTLEDVVEGQMSDPVARLVVDDSITPLRIIAIKLALGV